MINMQQNGGLSTRNMNSNGGKKPSNKVFIRNSLALIPLNIISN